MNSRLRAALEKHDELQSKSIRSALKTRERGLGIAAGHIRKVKKKKDRPESR
jgi:hypothetical protein